MIVKNLWKKEKRNETFLNESMYFWNFALFADK